jgi:NAD-dependent SIR2 family protein deacetylase
MLDYKDTEKFLNTIIEAINKKQLVLFVGSGLSKLCGLPLWKELSKDLLNFCASDSKCKFTYKEMDEVTRYIDDERELISIAKNILAKAYGSDDVFNQFLYKKLHVKANKKAEKIQKMLFGLSKTIFTTNADDILDKQLNPKNVIYNIEDLVRYKSEIEHQVIHIHGSIKRASSLVFTTQQYLIRYSDESFRSEISKLFSSDSPYVILFIGYGFREMQLLDFLVNVKAREIREKRTFLLNGYYSNQQNIFEVESEYYKEYGVTLVAYYKDEKNYESLIDALSFILAESNKKSLAQYNNINEITRLIEQNPTVEVLNKFKNEYFFLDTAQKTYCLETISNAKSSKAWVKKIILDKELRKEVFSLKQLVPGEIKEGKMTAGLPFPGLSLLVRVDCFSEETKDFYFKIIKKIINAYAKNNNLFSNQIAYKSFLKILFQQPEFLLIDNINAFFKKFIELSPEPDIWMLFSCYDNKVLELLPENHAWTFFKLMIETLQKYKRVTYEFTEFFKTYSNFYTESYSAEIINMLIPLESESFNEHRFYYETFETCMNQNSDLAKEHTYLKKWLGLSIAGLNSESSENVYKELKSSKDVFSTLASLYLANTHFERLRDLVLNDLKDYTTDKIYFSEIYSLIKNNVNYIHDQSINNVVIFIDNINYGSEYQTVFCKLDLIQLLKYSFPNNNYIAKKFNELNKFLVDNQLEEAYKNVKPYDRSKSFYISTSWDRLENSKLKSKVLSLELDEFVNYLKGLSKSVNNFEIYELSNYFDDLVDKFSLFNDEIIQRLHGAPNEFLDFMQARVNKLDINYKSKFELIKKIENLKESVESNASMLNSLYFLVMQENQTDSKTNDAIFEYLKTIEIDNKDFPFTNNDNIFSNETFLKYSVMIHACSTNNSTYLFNQFDTSLTEDNYYLKAAIVSQIHFLWNIDKTWVKDNIISIFNNNCNKRNLSYYAFIFSQCYEVEFVKCIFDNGILSNLLNSNEFKDVAWKYAYLLLGNFIYKNHDSDIVKLISKTDFYSNSLSLLLDYVERTQRKCFDKCRFDEMLKILMSSNVCAENSYHFGIDLLKFLDADEINDIEVDYICFSFSKHNSSFSCKQLYTILSSKKINCLQSDKIIKAFLINLEDYFYNEDEISHLLELMQNIDDKRIVLNALGKNNPGILTKLKI